MNTKQEPRTFKANSLRSRFFALCGFVRYNGMTAEKLALAVIRSEYLMPKRLVFRAENLYARALEHSSVKEALAHD